MTRWYGKYLGRIFGYNIKIPKQIHVTKWSIYLCKFDDVVYDGFKHLKLDPDQIVTLLAPTSWPTLDFLYV